MRHNSYVRRKCLGSMRAAFPPSAGAGTRTKKHPRDLPTPSFVSQEYCEMKDRRHRRDPTLHFREPFNESLLRARNVAAGERRYAPVTRTINYRAEIHNFVVCVCGNVTHRRQRAILDHSRSSLVSDFSRPGV